jgi:glutathione S-transferase
MMTMTLFELAGADTDVRFSPHCWKSRLALVLKRLAYEGEPVRFTEKEKIAFSGQALLPVLKDGEIVVNDSWEIAVYLEETYPDAPHLFTGEEGKAEAKVFNEWVDTELGQYIRPSDYPGRSAILSCQS